MVSDRIGQLLGELFSECRKDNVECVVMIGDADGSFIHEVLKRGVGFNGPAIRSCIAMLEERMRDPLLYRNDTPSAEVENEKPPETLDSAS